MIYDSTDKKQRALEFLYQSLTIARTAGDIRGEALALNNIGAVNVGLHEIPRALDYFNSRCGLFGKPATAMGKARRFFQ